MKKQLLNLGKVLKLKVFFVMFVLGIIFLVFHPNSSSAQTVLKGTIFVYNDEVNDSDTSGISSTNPLLKFYKVSNSGQLTFYKSTTVNADGTYSIVLNTTQDLYAVIFEDEQDNFVTSFFPGYLDFESAEVIHPNQDTLDYDWGAVGKEIVERPNGPLNTVTGTVNTTTKYSSDIIPSVYIFDSAENLVASAPIGADGRYSVSFSGTGNYEVFTSIAGYASQSKYVTTETSRGDFNVNFNLDVYRGESETAPVNSVADKFNLTQNYPNPFNPTTNISFTVNTTGLVKLTVYNSLGKEVTKLVNDLVEPGTYDITFNGQNLASGIYYYSLQVGNNVITKKMNLIK